MFTTTRHFYPHGIEGEAMDCTFKEFENLKKAIDYANKYTKGLRFAGITIENDEGNTVYEITSDLEIIDNSK